MKKRLSIFFAIALIACRERGDQSASLIKNDTALTTIDTTVGGSFFYRMKWARDHIGGLDTLEAGYPHFQIRIWYEYGHPLDRQIVVIKKENNWDATLYTTTWKYTDTGAYMIQKKALKGKPKMGWNAFIDSLTDLRRIHASRSV